MADAAGPPAEADVPQGTQSVLAWRVANLEVDVRDIRSTTVTQTEFSLRFGNLEMMVKEIRDGLANSKTRTMTYLVLPVVSGGLVSGLAILVSALTRK
jgi:hypothetical protein